MSLIQITQEIIICEYYYVFRHNSLDTSYSFSFNQAPEICMLICKMATDVVT